MNRREILKYVAALTGTAICSPLSASLLSNYSTSTLTANIENGQYFDVGSLQKLSQIMDVILPETDSPSASQVKVHLIMDNMFDKVFTPHYKKQFMTSFKMLIEYLDELRFTEKSVDEQVTMLNLVEQSKDSQKGFKAYIDIKQQSIAYYLSNEKISEKYLNYLPIPGGYTACVSVSEVGGKAWAE